MNKKILFLFIIIIISDGCIPAQHKPSTMGFQNEEIQIETPSLDINTAKLIKRENENVIILSFFEVFDDSISVFLNKKEIWKGNLYKKNNPYTSMGWSGVDVNCTLITPYNTVTIKLFNQKKCIKFSISRQFPIYIIQRYNGVWYVRGTKTSLNLK